MTIKELIERLERAEHADPVLDFWVWWWGKTSHRRDQEPSQDFADERILSTAAPNYSGDLKAAATLVPEGYRWRVEQLRNRFAAHVYPTVGETTAQVTKAKAAAPALCAAVLRTRMCFVNDVMRGRH